MDFISLFNVPLDRTIILSNTEYGVSIEICYTFMTKQIEYR